MRVVRLLVMKYNVNTMLVIDDIVVEMISLVKGVVVKEMLVIGLGQ